MAIDVLEVHGGKSVPYKVSSFTDQIKKTDFATSFTGLRALSIPCGTYRYTVARADMEIPELVGALSGWVNLDDPRQHLTIQTDGTLYDTKGRAYAVDVVRSKDYHVLGTVAGLKPLPEPAITRLIGAHFNRPAREVEVNPDGRFEFHALQRGNYVLLLLQGTRLLAAQDISIDKTDATIVIVQVPSGR